MALGRAPVRDRLRGVLLLRCHRGRGLTSWSRGRLWSARVPGGADGRLTVVLCQPAWCVPRLFE